MDNKTITEIAGSDHLGSDHLGSDIAFDQDIDTDTVIASSGGVAVNGDVKDSAINTGVNKGIMAGDDVSLDDSILGDDNLQVNDSELGAFALGGDATSASGEDVNLGSGAIFDVDAHEDVTIVTGSGNDVVGDVDVDVDDASGPVNVAVGEGNSQQAIEDQSTTIEGSFNADYSVEDSYNEATRTDTEVSYEDNDTTEYVVEDSFNLALEDNDVMTTELQFSEEDSSSYSSNDSWHEELEIEAQMAEVYGDGNEVDFDA